MVNGELERQNRARNSLSSYFVSASSRSFTSRNLLAFLMLKNSSIVSICTIGHWFLFTYEKSKVQRLIAQNRRFRFKLIEAD